MIDAVSTTNLIQSYQAKQPVESKQVLVQDNQTNVSPELMQKSTADAVKAYRFVAPPKTKAEEAKSLNDLKASLIQQGKVQGKDFEIEQNGIDSKLVILENNKPVKIYRYDKNGDNKEDFEAYQLIGYPINSVNGLKQTETTYDIDGRFGFRTNRYEKGNSPYENLAVNFETNDIDFESNLADNKVPFAVDHSFVGDNLVKKITVYDSKTNKMTRYEFKKDDSNVKNESVCICNLDSNGIILNEISFDKDETSYTEYKDSMIY